MDWLTHRRFGGGPVDPPPGQQRRFIPRDELLAAFEGAPEIDLAELRAESDAYIDPSAWCWDDWEAWTDRHIRRGGAGASDIDRI